ncbi:c-type cytochrome biogenesis protein CcmI [Amphiplicatus metriothermophilus]|uniref:Cytochrome c-type biogenesis protein CcmI n=1 Tax=Amphiplicatus metriothermophilus TaxID=1519374 RepID=A0A239PSX1_9PROT|nr:c-type cytochrome biogenesis protein CcmI [Amphiplicatus metriothermophilus]MBB5519320.1 cytochrome c-type biogenesis protein CcmI [Amphiplicatus metriothermophilus]SNT73391.1 cytochrome c-type biogenesis protein CcmI [Amphiplicatus metriothermophilus]
MLWIVIALTTAAACAFLAWPLLRRAPGDEGAPDERDYLVAQLREIERDRAAGALGAAEAEAAALEARRRLLAVSRAQDRAQKAASERARREAPVRPMLALAAAIPLAGAAFYLALGEPARGPAAFKPPAPSSAAQARLDAMSAEERAAMIESMVAGLAARLAEQPDDLEGWIMLGRSYAVLGDAAKSAEAYERAAALDPDDAMLRVAQGRALLALGAEEGREFDPAAREAFEAALRIDPDQPFALYFLGLAARAAGDVDTARAHWEKLLAQMPPDSEEAASLRALIEAL